MKAVVEMSRMLAWCLHESWKSSDAFRTSHLDDTPGDAMLYGISFLPENGFFRKRSASGRRMIFPSESGVFQAEISPRRREPGRRRTCACVPQLDDSVDQPAVALPLKMTAGKAAVGGETAGDRWAEGSAGQRTKIGLVGGGSEQSVGWF
jgi:hypothetical protein